MQERTETFTKQFVSESNGQLLDVNNIVDHMKRNFTEMIAIGRRTYWQHLIGSLINCCRKKSKNSPHNRYKWYLRKSQSVITKEMDLRKFLTRQRVANSALLGLLSSRQSNFVDKMAQMIIREDDSQSSNTSPDDELSDWQRDNMAYAAQMANSVDPVDKRFVNLYLLRKADQKNIRFGFANDILLSQNRTRQKRKMFKEDLDPMNNPLYLSE